MTTLDLYVNDLNQKNIKTHKDALKHFVVRYGSFIPNYPKESLIPACTLAENGLYFEENSKTIRCSECEFVFNDLNNDLLSVILHKHGEFNHNCSHYNNSINAILSPIQFSSYEEYKDEIAKRINDDEDVMEIEEIDETRANNTQSTKSMTSSASTSDLKSIQSQTPKKPIKSQFTNVDVRAKTFEGLKLSLNIKDLVKHGFYRVTPDDQTKAAIILKSNSTNVLSSSNLNEKMNSSSMSSSSNKQNDEELTNLEQIAVRVPASIHIRCAYCSYECLIFKNSLVNSLYRPPIEDHKEKNPECIVFNENKSASLPPSISSSNLVSLNTKLDWVQTLIDLDPTNENEKKASDFYLTSNNEVNYDDITVKQMPKVLDQLVTIELNKKSNRSINEPSTSSSGSNAVIYAPRTGVIPGASDFNKLQNVLNKSDNVISEKAYHPAYSLLQARLDSFKEWPATLSQQPQDLARAGFYYFGIKDMVKCFFCNGGLKNWDHNDDPYQDHVRWFPKCQFIKQLMGAEYVEQVREKYKNMDSGFTNDDYNPSQSSGAGKTTNSSTGSKNQNSFGFKSKRSISPRTLNSRMDTNMVRKLVDNKVASRESLKGAFEIKLSTNPLTPLSNYGDDFKSPIDLAKMSIELEKSKIDKLESFKALSDFIIYQFPSNLTTDSFKELISIKFGIFPLNVKIIREQGVNDKRCFSLVTLKTNNESKLDQIVQSLNNKPLSANYTIHLIVLKTPWFEYDEKIKPIVGNSVTVSTSSENVSPIEAPNQQANQSNQLETTTQIATNSSQITTVNPADEKKLSQKPADSGVNMTVDESSNLNDDTAMLLMEENERLKNERLCVVCLSKDKNVLFLPCAHLAACLDCSLSLQNCPMCRAKIQATVRTFT